MTAPAAYQLEQLPTAGSVGADGTRALVSPPSQSIAPPLAHARRPLAVFCAGLYSSGSTWLFNVAIAVCEAAAAQAGRPIPRHYADVLDLLPDLRPLPDVFVIKTHRPDRAMQMLAALSSSPVVLTVREPSDAIASLMARFHSDFDTALASVARSAQCCVELMHGVDPLVLRYEDRFYDTQATVEMVASHLELCVPKDAAARIWTEHTAEMVRLQIADRQRRGMFGDDAHPTCYDPDTHWHPGHVGDREIGKYRSMLSAEQQAQVIDATRDYCCVFGYERPDRFFFSAIDDCLRYPVGTRVRFALGSDAARFLASGWSFLETAHVWALGDRSEIVLRLADVPDVIAQFRLRLEVDAFLGGTNAQQLSILLNGELLCEARLRTRAALDLCVPRELIMRQHPSTITLIHPDNARPCDHLLGSTDARMISVALRSLQILPVAAEMVAVPPVG